MRTYKVKGCASGGFPQPPVFLGVFFFLTLAKRTKLQTIGRRY